MDGSMDSLSGKHDNLVSLWSKLLYKDILMKDILFHKLVLAPSMGSSPAVLLTPGRTRNIAQDMEALRLSRQDNPYLQVSTYRNTVTGWFLN